VFRQLAENFIALPVCRRFDRTTTPAAFAARLTVHFIKDNTNTSVQYSSTDTAREYWTTISFAVPEDNVL